MAASTSAGAPGGGGRRRGATRSKRGGGPRGRGDGALRRLQLAVEEFVQATSEGEARAGGEGPRAEGRGRPGGRRSRGELRREKRRLRKARRLRRPAGRARGPGPGGGGARAEGARPPPEAQAAPAPAQARRRPARPGPSAAAAAAARKRALLAANEEEDREIRQLARRLGLNKRRRGRGAVPPGFARDGLGYILGALGPAAGGALGLPGGGADSGAEDDGGPRGADGDEDRDAGALSEDEDAGALSEDGDEDGDAGALSEDGDAGALSEDGDEDEEVPQERRGKRVRFAEDEASGTDSSEAGGTAPQSLCANGNKYIPPHVRQAEETVDVQKREERERLRKHVQGLVNRLSEPNMASISGQLEELYMAHSRKDMSDTVTGVLLSACAPGVAVPGRLVMEHMLLVSILHRTVGIEVGAHFLEAVVRKFDDVYKNGSEGKECDNLFTIIAHLYNFHVVQSLLIFDVLKKLIGTFTEKDIELILLMLKNVGFSLRKDDALSLKELISEAQAKASGAHSQFQDQTRVRFMLETMLALKNNDMRKIPGYDPEPVEKLRKLQRALVRGAGLGPETQLRVSWDGILNAQHTGRWWIVGSAWSGAPMIDSCQQKVPPKQPAGTVSAKVLELARKQRMNTDVRRNIFCTIMMSEDFLDAFEKLLKLGLKDQQEREIVHVLVDCCLQEKTYNPFYAFLAAKLCDYERRFQMTFQFSIWDKFRDLENLPATNFSNLVHLVGHLLKTKALPLSILKVVEFSELDKPRVHFLRKVLYMLLMETEVEDLGLIFARVSDNPKLGVLREGLALFIRHFLLKSAQAAGSAEEASVLRARADLSSKALQGRASLRM